MSETTVSEPRKPRDIDPIPTQQQAPHLYDWAVICLSAVSILIVLVIAGLAYANRTIPEVLGSALLLALGALAGMVVVRAKA